LVVFARVAKERSFTKAAAELGFLQPALSQTVKSLEERLGLVSHPRGPERHADGGWATPAGHGYAELRGTSRAHRRLCGSCARNRRA
jgi:hypothetical protein